MKLLVFGASGLTGKEIVQQALEQGHHVTAFVRSPEKFQLSHSRLSIMKGNVADPISVDDAVKGQDAVICALGAKTPFKKDRVLVDGVQHIVKAMEMHAVKRLVYLSVIAIRDHREDLGWMMNRLIPLVMHNVIEDHTRKENFILNSKLDWTIVRAPKLTNGRFTGKYRTGERLLPDSIYMHISRKDLAEFMLQEAVHGKYHNKKPRIMY